MTRSVEFYQKLGFELLYGGESATFSSLKAGDAFVNLSASPGFVGPYKKGAQPAKSPHPNLSFASIA